MKPSSDTEIRHLLESARCPSCFQFKSMDNGERDSSVRPLASSLVAPTLDWSLQTDGPLLGPRRPRRPQSAAVDEILCVLFNRTRLECRPLRRTNDERRRKPRRFRAGGRGGRRGRPWFELLKGEAASEGHYLESISGKRERGEREGETTTTLFLDLP